MFNVYDSPFFRIETQAESDILAKCRPGYPVTQRLDSGSPCLVSSTSRQVKLELYSAPLSPDLSCSTYPPATTGARRVAVLNPRVGAANPTLPPTQTSYDDPSVKLASPAQRIPSNSTPTHTPPYSGRDPTPRRKQIPSPEATLRTQAHHPSASSPAGTLPFMAMNLPPLAGSGGAHTQPSLPALPAHLQSDTHLTAHLASRFHLSLPTAQLSSHALISLNTYTSSSKGPDGGKEGSAMAGAEEMAERAWLRLGHRSENQAVVFLGESGSGKSTLRSHLLASLLNKSSTPLSTKVSLAAYVFDTLTTTKTATTPTASKAGLFYELQYDTASTTNPVLIGGKLLDHRLERSRIADVPTGERNFHVLYYLLAGTSPAEKTHLGLEDSSVQQRRWNEIAEICQILASVLHIGQLEFESSANTQVTGDDSGGFSHEGATVVTAAKNKDVLAIIAAFLGVNAQDLQNTLSYKTKMIHKERVTVMLDPNGARSHANELARTIYSLLVTYIIESINQRLCAADDAVANTVSIIDFPGFEQQASTKSALDQLLNNSATEALYNLTLQNFFDRKADMLENEEPGNGLLSILDDQSRRHRTDIQFLESMRKRFEGKNPAITAGSSTAKLPGSNFLTENSAPIFTVKHFAGEVDYQVKGLIEENGEVISGDLLNMINSTKSEFVARLFGQDALQTVTHPKERSTVMQATISSKPMRTPSVMSRKTARTARNQRVLQQKAAEEELEKLSENNSQAGGAAKAAASEQGASGQFLAALDNVTKAVADPSTNSYFVFCLKPNDRRIASQFDSKCVRTQVQTFGIAEISQRLRSADFSLFLPFGEFLGLADAETILMGSERERVEMVVEDKRWPSNEVRIGSTGVFVSERCWMEIAHLSEASSAHGRFGLPSDGGDGLTPHGASPADPFAASKERLLSTGNTPLMYGEKGKNGYFGANDGSDSRSEAGVSAFGGGDMFKNFDTREQMAERGNEKSLVEVEEYRDSASRKRWLFMVYLLTWFIPDFLIRFIGRMPRKDVRMAWREKLAINLIIWLSCLLAAFFIVVFPMLICPRQHVYSAAELSAYDGSSGSPGAYVSIRGYVFDLEKFAPRHYPPNLVSTEDILEYAGKDATSLFPVQVSALCQGRAGSIDPAVLIDYRSTNVTGSPTLISQQDINANFHDFRYFTNDTRKDWYFQQMAMLRANYLKGRIGYSPKYMKTLARNSRTIVSMNGRVFDLTEYVVGGRRTVGEDGKDVSGVARDSVDFMEEDVIRLFRQLSGADATRHWASLNLSQQAKTRMLTCLNNLFYVGDVDTRSSVRCKFAEYLVLAISIMLVTIIAFKFFAALQFGTKNMPENLDKFIMCQIPAYTEDEDSLRRAIDSAARMHYDDKRKLLVVICDGMIVGQGNDRSTPRIVLDILGVSETVDPEPLSFESLGEGLKQHNMGKVYSGLYEVQGHIVPFLVVVKVGKPSEVSRPGNRGKRDSQMVIMRFLNRVHYNLAMSPLELEMYHQIRNIIGVNPTFYEFMFQIDADTVVAPDSATRMVSAFLDDTRLIAVCGETALTNAKSSFITMIQVYEYWISHNLTKAFESLFGSVTCLPGCFSMYRIRAAETGKPLFVSREIVEAYATIRVDTLHMKNLLHLGEDRYLTTLLLKFHNKYKTKYIFRAHAWTIAPDSWAVFMSQRRRWINSTVHNLIELIPMAQLCGFCCFSMRFIVFVDLLSTVLQPVTMAYIVYLIVMVIRSPDVVPVTAFILIAAVFGLQAIIFILRRKWEMIGWMIIVTDEGKFDPASIPRKKWEEYQGEIWEAQTVRDDARSEVSGYSYATKGHPGVQVGVSEYGGYSRPGSIAGGFSGAHAMPPLPMNTSRMSLAASEMGGNRASQFGGSQYFSPEDMVGPAERRRTPGRDS
ncbi:chitin synthase [Verticillium alfalfae VaMs.102]|uniref:chitin synthase n=3 Tax=Verticillium TaxID=1036719 RepID=C9S7B6_VERA1|nr:chitin synthase [Verticillium alfalfae VaMs.102]EEY14701.1 chitin synthase [Verticillium alfalfae VaMs.102]